MAQGATSYGSGCLPPDVERRDVDEDIVHDQRCVDQHQLHTPTRARVSTTCHSCFGFAVQDSDFGVQS